VDLLLTHGIADHHGDDDEGDPAPDRELAVLRAPVGGARGYTARRLSGQ
jgi:hypothetical protein